MGPILTHTGLATSRPANALGGGRGCAWSAPGGVLLSLRIQTQAEQDAAAKAMERILGHPYFEPRVQDLLDKTAAGDKTVANLGDGALLKMQVNDFVEVRVVKGQTGFTLGALSFHRPDTASRLTDLARIVVDRLGTVPAASPGG